jgi:hypothetical protein
MDFSEWILRKYLNWRGDSIGNDKSITQFAKIIGVSQSLMTQWMKKGGKVPSSQKYITALANVYGDEVYTVLGLPVPAAVQPVELDLPLDLPPAFRALMIAAGNELSAALIANKIDPTSPEGLALADAIMEKHGYKRIVSTNPGKPG